MLTLIGLGVEPQDVSLGALQALRAADDVIVRTDGPIREIFNELKISYRTLDELYLKSRTYDTLKQKIVKEVSALAREKNVCYCTDGSVLEDEAALALKKKGASVFDARSKASYFAEKANLSGDFLSASAFSLPEKPVLPLVLYDLTEDNLSKAKLFLSERFGDEKEVVWIGDTIKTLKLFEIDREKTIPKRLGLVLKETPLLQKERFDFSDVWKILLRLRAPDGCPWDRVQTHESLKTNLIEESYELLDALDLGDPEKICEEVGDVLMQSLFHTLIEEEKGGFTLSDMLTALCKKLITRHTHVFGKDEAKGEEGALSVWEKNKREEKHQSTYSDAVLDVPQCFPALLRAQKVAKRLEKGGWDKASLSSFEKKFREEYLELKKALKAGNEEEIFSETGDLLFCAVELGRALKVDCETALLNTVKKMQARYAAFEALVLKDKKDVLTLSERERDEYYQKAKDGA